MNSLSSLFNIENNSALSQNAKTIIREEERSGIITANIFRYIFSGFVAVSVLWNTFAAEYAGYNNVYLGNLGALLCYILVTIGHSIVIKHGSNKINQIYSYLAIIMDYAIVTLIIYYWMQIQQTENMAFFLKNPTVLYYILPIILPIFQFNLRLVVFSFLCFILLYFTIIFLSIQNNVPTTQNWYDYVLGDSVILSDIFTMRPVLFFCVAMAVGYAIIRAVRMVLRISTIEAQKGSLSKYFSPSVVNEILENPDMIDNGRMINAVILFQDIRNFTQLSEGLDPDVISTYLSKFRQYLSTAVFKSGGMVDKYIGDAIMAVFGAPHPSEDPKSDVVKGINAGLEMREALKQFNNWWESQGNDPVKIGIGMHYGEVFAGNVGFEGQLEYTVIGDPVNTASRIENLCKKFEADFIISDEVYSFVKDEVEVKKLPLVKVKGKSDPLQLYHLIGKSS
jgi:adenylate cyclase